MIDPEIEELLESLYEYEIEDDQYPSENIVQKGAEGAVSLNLVELYEGKYKLTEVGKEAGKSVVRRHRLAERLLQDVLAVGPGHIEEDACRFEHVLQDEVDEKVCILLGHPTHCPHGKPIPQGQCCIISQSNQIKEVRPLCDAKSESEGTVAYLATQDGQQVRKLMAMGILPGANIKIIQRFPSYVFKVGYSQFAVDCHLAKVIYVHWND